MAPKFKANTLQIDPDVQIPEAVRRAAAAADAAMQAAQLSPTEPPAPAPQLASNDTITIAPPPEPTRLPGQVPLTIEPAPPLPPPQPQLPQELPQPAPNADSGSWENKYNSMLGRYRDSNNQLTMANSRIEALENMLATMQTAPTAPTPPPQPVKYLTPKDEEEMGSEMIDFVRRVAREELAPLQPIAETVQRLDQTLRGTTQRIELTARQQMHADLAAALPDWQTINHATEFHEWLALRDPYSGVTRKQMLTDAYAKNETSRVLSFFKGFVSETAAQRPASPELELPPVAAPSPQPVRPTLTDLAAPGRARTAAAPAAPAEKQIIRTSDVNAFYAAVRRGAYKGREQLQAEHEAELHAAMRENRVVRDT